MKENGQIKLPEQIITSLREVQLELKKEQKDLEPVEKEYLQYMVKAQELAVKVTQIQARMTILTQQQQTILTGFLIGRGKDISVMYELSEDGLYLIKA